MASKSAMAFLDDCFVVASVDEVRSVFRFERVLLETEEHVLNLVKVLPVVEFIVWLHFDVLGA